MSKHEVVRSWKDPQFRASLSHESRARLPESPAGIVEVSELELSTIAGGNDVDTITYAGGLGPTSACCQKH